MPPASERYLSASRRNEVTLCERWFRWSLIYMYAVLIDTLLAPEGDMSS